VEGAQAHGVPPYWRCAPCSSVDGGVDS
jgi:hypothetical protein